MRESWSGVSTPATSFEEWASQILWSGLDEMEGFRVVESDRLENGDLRLLYEAPTLELSPVAGAYVGTFSRHIEPPGTLHAHYVSPLSEAVEYSWHVDAEWVALFASCQWNAADVLAHVTETLTLPANAPIPPEYP